LSFNPTLPPFFRCNIVRQSAIIGSVIHGALVFAAVARGLCIRNALVFAGIRTNLRSSLFFRAAQNHLHSHATI
jgi:hypothetical protein